MVRKLVDKRKPWFTLNQSCRVSVLFLLVFLLINSTTITNSPLFAQGIDAIITARVNPPQKAREWLANNLSITSPLVIQRNYITTFKEHLLGVGGDRKIRIGNKDAASLIPVYFKDGSASFLTLNLRGEVFEMPGIPMPSFDIYLLPEEWNMLRKSPETLPENWFFLPLLEKSHTWFPVYHAVHSGFIEKVGIPVTQEEIRDFFVISGASAIPGRDIEEGPLPASQREDVLNFQYRPRTREAPLTSLAASTAMAMDWWKIASAGSGEVTFAHYINPFNGAHEYGCDFWKLHQEYLNRASDETNIYPLTSLVPDTVLEKPTPTDMRSMALIGLENVKNGLPEIRQLFSQHQGKTAEVKLALQQHGVILAGIPPMLKGVPLNFSLFAVIVVGIGQIGGKDVVLYREPYAVSEFDRTQGVVDTYPLRVIPLSMIREAWQFPHGLTAELEYDWNQRQLKLLVKVVGGGNTDPSILEGIFSNDQEKFLFNREQTGVYTARIPRRWLVHENPEVKVRLRKDYFQMEKREWLEKTLIIR